MKLLNHILFNNILFIPEVFLLLSTISLFFFNVAVTMPINKKSVLNVNVFFLNLLLVCYLVLIVKNFNSIAIGFNSAINVSIFINGFKVIIILALIVLNWYLLYSLQYDNIYSFEFFFFLSMCLVGSIVVISATNLLSFIFGLEIQSLSLYILIAYKRNSILALEGAIKYFLVGVISSIFSFVGIFLIYMYFNTIYFTELSEVAPELDTDNVFWPVYVMLFLASIFFKCSVYPFQFWAPDVYQTAQTGVVLFVSTLSKLTVLIFLIRFINISALIPDLTTWYCITVPFLVVTVTLGALRGLVQTNIKRIFAYSSMVNIVFIFLPLATLLNGDYSTVSDPIFDGLCLTAGEKTKVVTFTLSIFYLLVYILLNGIFFLTLMVLRRVSYNKLYRELVVISDFNGLAAQNPLLAFVIASTMFSLAGLPPFLGFFNKYFIIIELINQSYYFLAGYILLCSIIAMFYYIKIIKATYFEPNKNLSDSENLLLPKLNVPFKPFFFIESKLLNFIIVLNFFNGLGLITFYFFYKWSFYLALNLVLNGIII